MAAVYDPDLRAWVNRSTGELLPTSELVDLRNEMADHYGTKLGQLARDFLSGDLDAAAWRQSFLDAVAHGVSNGYTFGRGGPAAMTDADYDRLADLLDQQFRYADTFLDDLIQRLQEADDPGVPAVTRETIEARTVARSEQYAGGVVTAYEQAALVAKSGDGPELGDYVTDYPADGGTECIADPMARVVTMRGMVPISQVVIGDMVLTHRGRWQPVSRAIVRPAVGKSFANLQTTGGPVRFTVDHELLTRSGWYPVDGIMRAELPVYTMTRIADENRDVRGLRTALRSSGETLHAVRQQGEGGGTMGRPSGSQSYGGIAASCASQASAYIRRSFARFKLANQVRWTQVHLVLGWRPAANDLPLSVGMDSGTWTDSAGDPNPSRQRGQSRRSTRELAGAHSDTPPAASHQNPPVRDAQSAGCRTAERIDRHVRTVPNRIQGDLSGQGKSLLLAEMPHRLDADNSHLPDVWTDVHRWAGSWQTPQILRTGVLSEGTPLYDLTVEGDHSFVVEGIVAHNCGANCRCWLDVEDFDTEWIVNWTTENDDRVCDGCQARADKYNNLVIPKPVA